MATTRSPSVFRLEVPRRIRPSTTRVPIPDPFGLNRFRRIVSTHRIGITIFTARAEATVLPSRDGVGHPFGTRGNCFAPPSPGRSRRDRRASWLIRDQCRRAGAVVRPASSSRVATREADESGIPPAMTRGANVEERLPPADFSPKARPMQGPREKGWTASPSVLFSLVNLGADRV